MIFGGLDRMCAAIAKAMEAKPKNNKKKKNGKINQKTFSKSCSSQDADVNRSIIDHTVS